MADPPEPRILVQEGSLWERLQPRPFPESLPGIPGRRPRPLFQGNLWGNFMDPRKFSV